MSLSSPWSLEPHLAVLGNPLSQHSSPPDVCSTSSATTQSSTLVINSIHSDRLRVRCVCTYVCVCKSRSSPPSHEQHAGMAWRQALYPCRVSLACHGVCTAETHNEPTLLSQRHLLSLTCLPDDQSCRAVSCSGASPGWVGYSWDQLTRYSILCVCVRACVCVCVCVCVQLTGV